MRFGHGGVMERRVDDRERVLAEIGSTALGLLRQSLGGTTDRREMTMVEVAQFDTVL